MSTFCDLTLPNRIKENGEELKKSMVALKDLHAQVGSPRLKGINDWHLNAEARSAGQKDPFFRKLIRDLKDEGQEQLIRDKLANARANELADDNLSYVAHLLTPEAREVLTGEKGRIGGYVLSNKHASMLARDPAFKGKTVSEINQLAKDGKLSGKWQDLNGKKLLIDDPQIVQAIRARRTNKVFGAVSAMDEAAKKFGRVVADPSDLPHGWVYSDNPYLKGQNVAFPKEIRDMVDKHWNNWFDDKKSNAILDTADKVTNLWKAHTLAWFPGYYIKNFLGNIAANAQTGTKDIGAYARAMNIQMGKDGVIRTVDGRVLKNDEVKQMALEHGVLNTGYYSQAPKSVEQEIKGGDWNLLGSNSKPMNWMQNKGKAIENNARLAKFVDELEKGAVPMDAARAVNKALFNYGDRSMLNNGLDRVAPFVTWQLKNYELQLKMMFEHPGQFKAIDTIHNDIEQNSDSTDDEKYLSDYLKDLYPTRIRSNKDGTSDYFVMGGWVPVADLPAIINTPINHLMGNLHPALRTAIEWGTNSRVENLGKNIPLAHDGQQQMFLGRSMDKQTAEALKNIRILSEASHYIDNDRIDARSNTTPLTTKEKFLNFITGFRKYSQDLPANHIKAMKDVIKDLEDNVQAEKNIYLDTNQTPENQDAMVNKVYKRRDDIMKDLDDTQ